MGEENKLVQSVQEFQAGKEEAFEDIYAQTNRYVYYSIFKSVGNEEIAEDVLQETYLEIYKNLSALRSPEAFKKWAATIAQHKITHYFMKKDNSFFKGEQEESELETLIEDDADLLPEDSMENKETQRLISEIIDNLPMKHREAIVAFYYNQMSMSEIAEAMGVPENTVKTYLFRGKAKIKDGILELEQKHGTKLYTIGMGTILFFLFGEEASACELPIGSISLVNEVRRLFSESNPVNEELNASITNQNVENIAKDATKEVIKKGAASKVVFNIAVAVIGVALISGIGVKISQKLRDDEPAVEIAAEKGEDTNSEPIEKDASKTEEEIAAEEKAAEEKVAEEKAAEEERILAEKEELKKNAITEEVVLNEPILMPSDEELAAIAAAYVNILNTDVDIYNTDMFGLYDITGDGIPEIYDNKGTIMFTYLDGAAYYMYFDMVINEFYFDLDTNQFVVHYSWKGTEEWKYHDVNVGNGSPDQWLSKTKTENSAGADQMELLVATYANDTDTKNEMVKVLKSYYRGEQEYSSENHTDTSDNPIVYSIKYNCPNCGKEIICDTSANALSGEASMQSNYIDSLSEGLLGVYFYCESCKSYGYRSFSFNSKAYEWVDYDDPSAGVKLNNGDAEAFFNTSSFN